MRRLLGRLLDLIMTLSPHDPNLDRRDDWEPRRVGGWQ